MANRVEQLNAFVDAGIAARRAGNLASAKAEFESALALLVSIPNGEDNGLKLEWRSDDIRALIAGVEKDIRAAAVQSAGIVGRSKIQYGRPS